MFIVRSRFTTSVVRRFRPDVAGLEPRVQLTGTSSGQILVAAIGDSYSDEYSTYGPPVGLGVANLFGDPTSVDITGRDSARNWPFLLAATRPATVSLGDYSSATREEPRDQGFAQDWARAGVAATNANPYGNFTFLEELVGTATSPGLLTQTRATTGTNPTDIGAVTITLGLNDYLFGFLDYLQSSGTNDGFVSPPGSTLTPVNATIESAIAGAVSAIQTAMPSTRIVLVTTPDITQTSFLRPALAAYASAFPNLGAQMRASDEALTSDLATFAAAERIGLVDFDGLVQSLRQNPTVGGITVNVDASGADLSDGYVGDGLHPGTMLQGRLGQAIVGAIDQVSGSIVIPPITDAEIAAFALASTPTVALGASSTSGSVLTTLYATIANGAGATTAPTGTVAFETLIAASGTTPARFGTLLGQVVLPSSGSVSVTISTSELASGPIVAVYSGDEAHTTQLSGHLTASQVVLVNPIVTPAPMTPAPITPMATLLLTPTYSRTSRGSFVTLTATIAGLGLVPDPSPAGTVALYQGTQRLKFLAVAGGRAVVTFPLARLRGRVVSATYTGDGILPAATAAAVRIAPTSLARPDPLKKASTATRLINHHR